MLKFKVTKLNGYILSAIIFIALICVAIITPVTPAYSASTTREVTLKTLQYNKTTFAYDAVEVTKDLMITSAPTESDILNGFSNYIVVSNENNMTLSDTSAEGSVSTIKILKSLTVDPTDVNVYVAEYSDLREILLSQISTTIFDKTYTYSELAELGQAFDATAFYDSATKILKIQLGLYAEKLTVNEIDYIYNDISVSEKLAKTTIQNDNYFRLYNLEYTLSDYKTFVADSGAFNIKLDYGKMSVKVSNNGENVANPGKMSNGYLIDFLINDFVYGKTYVYDITANFSKQYYSYDITTDGHFKMQITHLFDVGGEINVAVTFKNVGIFLKIGTTFRELDTRTSYNVDIVDTNIYVAMSDANFFKNNYFKVQSFTADVGTLKDMSNNYYRYIYKYNLAEMYGKIYAGYIIVDCDYTINIKYLVAKDATSAKVETFKTVKTVENETQLNTIDFNLILGVSNLDVLKSTFSKFAVENIDRKTSTINIMAQYTGGIDYTLRANTGIAQTLTATLTATSDYDKLDDDGLFRYYIQADSNGQKRALIFISDNLTVLKDWKTGISAKGGRHFILFVNNLESGKEPVASFTSETRTASACPISKAEYPAEGLDGVVSGVGSFFNKLTTPFQWLFKNWWIFLVIIGVLFAGAFVLKLKK